MANTMTEVDRGRQHFMKTLGNIPEPIRAMIEYAPDLFAGYLQMREFIYRTPPAGSLDLKTKELIYVLLDIVTGNQEGAQNHLQAGMKAGLTLGELVEGCMQVMHVCGITTWGKTGWKVCDFAAKIEADTRAAAGKAGGTSASRAKAAAGKSAVKTATGAARRPARKART